MDKEQLLDSLYHNQKILLDEKKKILHQRHQLQIIRLLALLIFTALVYANKEPAFKKVQKLIDGWSKNKESLLQDDKVLYSHLMKFKINNNDAENIIYYIDSIVDNNSTLHYKIYKKNIDSTYIIEKLFNYLHIDKKNNKELGSYYKYLKQKKSNNNNIDSIKSATQNEIEDSLNSVKPQISINKIRNSWMKLDDIYNFNDSDSNNYSQKDSITILNWSFLSFKIISKPDFIKNWKNILQKIQDKFPKITYDSLEHTLTIGQKIENINERIKIQLNNIRENTTDSQFFGFSISLPVRDILFIFPWIYLISLIIGQLIRLPFIAISNKITEIEENIKTIAKENINLIKAQYLDSDIYDTSKTQILFLGKKLNPILGVVIKGYETTISEFYFFISFLLFIYLCERWCNFFDESGYVCFMIITSLFLVSINLILYHNFLKSLKEVFPKGLWSLLFYITILPWFFMLIKNYLIKTFEIVESPVRAK